MVNFRFIDLSRLLPFSPHRGRQPPCEFVNHKMKRNRLKLFVDLVIAISFVSTVLLTQATCLSSTTLCEDTTNSKESFSPPVVLALPPITITEQQQQRRRKPRILLGIFTILDIFSERQSRHLIRNTYLAFDKVHRTDTPNRVCSLQDFSSNKELVDNEDCQLVYTFVLSGNPNNNGTSSLEFNETYPLTIDPSLIDNHEQDVIYLNVPETNRVGKVWAWYHYCATALNNGQGLFDYIVKTDAQVAILPTLFWKNDIFLEPPRQRVYGGIPELKSKCIEKKCPSLQGDYVMRRFVLLSTDLVNYVSASY